MANAPCCPKSGTSSELHRNYPIAAVEQLRTSPMFGRCTKIRARPHQVRAIKDTSGRKQGRVRRASGRGHGVYHSRWRMIGRWPLLGSLGDSSGDSSDRRSGVRQLPVEDRSSYDEAPPSSEPRSSCEDRPSCELRTSCDEEPASCESRASCDGRLSGISDRSSREEERESDGRG